MSLKVSVELNFSSILHFDLYSLHKSERGDAFLLI